MVGQQAQMEETPVERPRRTRARAIVFIVGDTVAAIRMEIEQLYVLGYAEQNQGQV
ncbi:hypothetical protein [Leptolyngbya sp. FACHB-261]|uniref:hypothetical protein n=1 Tax=Leptolyngbya sp. FACHB-261 TaxID=2692806 RepID=UPI00168238E6|nr:hypothetical protein [Leptolyngbya sp. FACHB-261]MBD2101768.1 hypothetical protein [Leptolyngbya sp. FACHB-261]